MEQGEGRIKARVQLELKLLEQEVALGMSNESSSPDTVYNIPVRLGT